MNPQAGGGVRHTHTKKSDVQYVDLKHPCNLCVSYQFIEESLLVLPFGLKLPLLLLQHLQSPLLIALLLQQEKLLQFLLLSRLWSAGRRTSHLWSLPVMPHWTSLCTASSHRRGAREKLPPNVSLHAFGTYKFDLILLDDISVFPLVLLHSQLGVLHISVVCQVMYCRRNTQTSVKWSVYITRSVCPKADTLRGLLLAIFCLTTCPNLTMWYFTLTLLRAALWMWERASDETSSHFYF